MSTKLSVEEKAVVVPGDVLADGMDYLPSQGTYRLGKEIRAGILGLLSVEGRALRIIPLSGRYHPKKYDVIIGMVVDVMLSGWKVDTNSAYVAVLPVRDATSAFIRRDEDLTRIFAIGDYIVAKIINVTSQNLVDLTTKGPGLRKLEDGRIIKANTNKVPRIIGKKGSMISMIKNATNTNIIVGQNGVIWAKGSPKDEVIVVDTIRKIEEEAHKQGLTDNIKNYLEQRTGKKITVYNQSNETNEINETNETNEVNET